MAFNMAQIFDLEFCRVFEYAPQWVMKDIAPRPVPLTPPEEWFGEAIIVTNDERPAPDPLGGTAAGYMTAAPSLALLHSAHGNCADGDEALLTGAGGFGDGSAPGVSHWLIGDQFYTNIIAVPILPPMHDESVMDEPLLTGAGGLNSSDTHQSVARRPLTVEELHTRIG